MLRITHYLKLSPVRLVARRRRRICRIIRSSISIIWRWWWRRSAILIRERHLFVGRESKQKRVRKKKAFAHPTKMATLNPNYLIRGVSILLLYVSFATQIFSKIFTSDTTLLPASLIQCILSQTLARSPSRHPKPRLSRIIGTFMSLLSSESHNIPFYQFFMVSAPC